MPIAPIAMHLLGGLLALAFVGGGAWQLLGLAARDTFELRQTIEDDVDAIVIEPDAGDVILTGAPAGAPVRIAERVTRGLWEPERRTARDRDGTLRLSAKCWPLNNGYCAVRYTVAVPAGTAVTVRTQGGAVSAAGLRSDGAVKLSSSGGEIDARGIEASAVVLRTSAGSVRATGVAAREITANSSAGSVEVAAIRAPRRLRVHSSAGRVTARVPDAVYDVRASSSAGEVRDEGLRRDPASPNRIDATSSAGDVILGVSR